MEYIAFIIAVVVILLIITIAGNLDNQKKKKKYLLQLQKMYGTFSAKEIKPELLESIASYYHRHQKESQIDDITWNDLELDRLYQMMDCMQSSAGEEYLYYTLRTPKVSQDEIEEQETLIHFFDTHENERIRFQSLCKELGKTGKYSFYDYMDYLIELGKRSNLKQHIVNFMFILAIVAIFINTAIGLVSLFFLICFNMVTYFKEKDDIAPYITSFLYIMRILRFTEKLEKMNLPELEIYVERMSKNRKKFRKFTRHANLVMSDMAASGNPLELVLDYLKMVFHIDIIKFNSMLSELQTHVPEVDEIVTEVGFLESTIAVGNYRRALKTYCIPEYIIEKRICCKEVYHPYIEDPVKNSIDSKKGVLLTGSNASGKSTFLKTIALNAITAQTIHTVAAKQYQACFFHIYSSMSLRDSLSSGESYYMVEIRSLKRILDVIRESKQPVLCFVDEVLRGTNTVERIAASTQILKSLVGNAICFAATHDVELTTLLKDLYANYHFTEEVVAGDVLFNYKLQDGPATTRNAIKLLETIGYESDMIREANQQAEHFLETGIWTA